jgi:hypothetical protein
VAGFISYDKISFPNQTPSFSMKFLGILMAKSMEGNQYDGIVGLMPNPLDNSSLIVNSLKTAGVIQKSIFEFFVGDEAYSPSFIQFGAEPPSTCYWN